MKLRTRFLAFTFLLLSYDANCQFFQNLLDRANQALNEKVNSMTDKFVNNSLNNIEKQITGNYVVVSQKVNKVARPNYANLHKSTTTTNNSKAALSKENINENDNTYNIVENHINEKFPSFASAYHDVLNTNDKIKGIYFIVRDKHEWSSAIINNNIYFDLYSFDETKKDFSEGAKVWELLYQISNLENSGNINLKTAYDKVYANFIFALNKSKQYAENGDCITLKHAVTVWKTKLFPNSNLATSNTYQKEQARNKIITEELFKSCENYYSTNCNK